MIKAVVFDYGGVITFGGRGGNELTIRLAQNLGISVERASELTFGPWPEYIKGRISEDEYWGRIETKCGQPIPIGKRMIWNTWEHMSPEKEMLDFVKQLKAEGYTVGLLSNVIPNTEKEIRAHGVYDLFQPCILSCQIGLAKPEATIYQALLEQLPGVEPNEIIYIDDQERCLEPARKLGIHCVLSNKPEQVITDIKRLLQK